MDSSSAIPPESGDGRNRASAPPPRTLRFSLGFALGIFVGVLLQFLYFKYYINRDRIERRDRNNDGAVDVWLYYEDGEMTREESDDNFDGKKDVWYTLTPEGFTSNVEQDTDHNGIRDFRTLYTNGIPAHTDWQPNGTNVVLLRQIFRQGIVREELHDINGDGRFDTSVTFDSFSTPVSTNYLQAPGR